MANFNTHILSSAVLGSLAATTVSKLFELPVSTALLLTVCGAVGGVLPDIDLKHSTPGKILFSVLGFLLALGWLFARLADFSVLELWLFAMAIYLTVRFPIWALFHQLTVHRGALHSLAAAMMFSFVSAALAYTFFSVSATLSWMLAAFVASGYVLHLILDEIYSVDFLGARIKRSFGSALKLLDTQRPAASCMVLFVTLVAWFWTPPTDPLWAMLSSKDVDWSDVLLPEYIELKQQR